MDDDGDVSEESEEIEAQSQEDGEGESVSDDSTGSSSQLQGRIPTTPAAPGSVLRGTSEENTVGYPEQRRYWSGVGKLLYLMKWSRPDILNSVRDLSRFLSGARPAHLKAMYRVME